MKKHLIGLLLILSVLGVHSVMADYVNNGGGTPLLSWYKVSLDSFLIDVRSKDGNPVGGVSIYTQYSAPAQYWDRRYTSFFTWYYTTSYATYVYDYENYTTNACGSVETKPIKVKANLSEKPEFYIWAKPVIEKDFTVEFPTGEKMNYRCATMSVIDNDGHLDQVNGRAGNIVPGRKVAHTECDNWGKDFVRG
ncbi:MAG: hypothetical protein ACXVBW_09425, partial [Bdellovibrionota bacterium]